MNQTMTVREQVSALADGHLQGDEFAQAIDKVCGDEEYRAAWQAYHVVGDVLRSGSTTACSDGNAFLARFQQRLAAEVQLAMAQKLDELDQQLTEVRD